MAGPEDALLQQIMAKVMGKGMPGQPHAMDPNQPPVSRGNNNRAYDALSQRKDVEAFGGDGSMSMVNEMAQLMDQLGLGDPNNMNPNLPPMQMEDDENGYWDAQNMGNGQGNSFIMENGQQRMADPVGNGADPAALVQMILQGQAQGKEINGQYEPSEIELMVDDLGLPPEELEMLMENLAGIEDAAEAKQVIDQFVRRRTE